MKVLFIHANNSISLFDNAIRGVCESNDYLTDSIFQEMKNDENFEVFECPHMSHMYEDSKTDISNITGLGFTIRKKIKKIPNILEINECLYKIKNNFFDLIVTDSRTMNPWWNSRGLSPFFNNAMLLKNQILKTYHKDKIIFFDGEDQPEQIQTDFYKKSRYFKRELIKSDENLFPIGYSFPMGSFREIKSIDEKIKPLSHIIPGIRSTYIFNDENTYYNDYRTSLFGLTWRKLGWDCFRHHEIIFSSCLPIFPDILDCPERTMTKFPKKICSDILKMNCVNTSKIEKKWIASNLYYFDGISIDMDKFNSSEYQELLNDLLYFSFNNLTSRKMLDYILNTK
jgi:hypothetical protein